MGAKELAETYQSYSLRGLHGVRVLLTDLNSDAKQEGLIKSELQTDVELRLRKAGIRVLTGEDGVRRRWFLYSMLKWTP
ncbi:MAG: hypothetical protein C4291_13930 [Candidatus Dadabacteria bacterium]